MDKNKYLIPRGMYCNNCPYWEYLDTINLHANPPNATFLKCEYHNECSSRDKCWTDDTTKCMKKVIRCHYLGITDYGEDSLLWDKVKECDINK